METASTLNVKVIIGSTRPGRFSEKPAHWIYQEAKMRDGLDVDLLDLRDYPLPFFDEAPQVLRTGEYVSPVAARWAQQVRGGDGYVIVSPEYNHGSGQSRSVQAIQSGGRRVTRSTRVVGEGVESGTAAELGADRAGSSV